MTFAVLELSRAKADKRQILKWLMERSRAGASAWLDAYDRMIERLKHNADTFAMAFENADLDADVRQALFKTKRGRVYRALFMIEGEVVYVLRVRGPGQAPVGTTDDE